MTLEVFGWAFLISIIVVGVVEIRRVVLSLNADMRAILNHQQEIRRRLDALEKRK